MVENQYHHTRLFNVEYIWYRSNKTSIYSGFSMVFPYLPMIFPGFSHDLHIYSGISQPRLMPPRKPTRSGVARWCANTQAIHEKVPELGIPWRRVEFPGKRWDNMWRKHEGTYTEICEKLWGKYGTNMEKFGNHLKGKYEKHEGHI